MLEKGSGREGGESAAVVANQRRPVRKSRVEQAEHQRSLLKLRRTFPKGQKNL